MKNLVKRIQGLRHIGIEDNGLPLPKICVVGDQSTGKSSLIEGMSEIKVPRSAGCCTRCPLEINLSESEGPNSWSCRVILMKKYMYVSEHFQNGKRGGPSKSKPLGPWVEQDPEEELFATLTDVNKVQEALKWAQLATLNPWRSPKEYILGEENVDMEESTQVKFSPNVVRLDIMGHRFPNLSFYDLPGVINVAEVEEERYLVTLVENLVKHYIKANNCIVLLTLPMTDDATNSSASRLIRDVPGATARTLGVLTKPDRIHWQRGEYQQWLEILRGEKFAVGHGYHIVKNNANPNVEHYVAREEEEEFFSCGPWKEQLSFSAHSDRFGMKNLQMALSKLLMQQIQTSLPNILDQLEKRRAAVEDELKELPDPPSANISYLLCDKINQFDNFVQNSFDESKSNYQFLKQWAKLASDFKLAIEKIRPGLQLVTDAERYPPFGKRSVEQDASSDISELKFNSKRKLSPTFSNGESKRPKMTSSIPRGSTSGTEFQTGHFENFRGRIGVDVFKLLI